MAYRFSDTKRMFGGKEYSLSNVFRTKEEAQESSTRVRSSGYFTRVTLATTSMKNEYGARYALWIRWNKLPKDWNAKKSRRMRK